MNKYTNVYLLLVNPFYSVNIEYTDLLLHYSKER